jgi:hypothetical protein
LRQAVQLAILDSLARFVPAGKRSDGSRENFYRDPLTKLDEFVILMGWRGNAAEQLVD